MQITPIPCLTDNYAYIINDNNSKTIGVVDPSEAQPIISYLKKENLKLNDMFRNNDFEWLKLTDDYVYVLLRLSNNKLLKRIDGRHLYHTLTKKEANSLSDPSQVIISKKVLGFVNENVNPLANIQFFDKSDYNKSYKIKMKEISNLMPLQFIETNIQYISKS